MLTQLRCGRISKKDFKALQGSERGVVAGVKYCRRNGMRSPLRELTTSNGKACSLPMCTIRLCIFRHLSVVKFKSTDG
jgi:hypothetical protein